MDDQRRALFVAWFAGPPMNGDRAALMKKSKLTKGRVTQLLNADSAEPFGSLAASRLAKRLGLPAGAFEPATAGWPFKTLSPTQWGDVSQDVRDAAEGMLLSAAQKVRLVKSDAPDHSEVAGVRSSDAEVTASRGKLHVNRSNRRVPKS